LQEEFIYFGLTAKQRQAGTTIAEYKQAEWIIYLTCGVFAIFLLLEFLFLTFGFSVMYKKTNAWQVCIHGMGILSSMWMIADSWRFQILLPLTLFFGILPCLLEVWVTCDALEASRRERNYQQVLQKKFSSQQDDSQSVAARQ
jgi:hypothetical protein